ncbi:Nin one binding Zn-ribbon like-domain-containing protein [Phellopilus nigrolimitatus]|nr:Nin one binding Zn-ribbon like-domain-containing protein [Phellopilus nigrolimitatus]
MDSKPACKSLVLDAGPLLSLSPLRGLAEHFLTVPQVLSELKDKNARQHFERLGLSADVRIEVREADPASLSRVIQFAKKTGDYSVLSHADLCVLALTLALDTQEKAEKATQDAETALKENGAEGAASSLEASRMQRSTAEDSQQGNAVESTPSAEVNADGSNGTEDPEENALVESSSEDGMELEGGEIDQGQHVTVDEDEDVGADVEQEPLGVTIEPVVDTPSPSQQASSRSQDNAAPADSLGPPSQSVRNVPVFEDPSDEDDGEGEWITPANVDMYKSRALELFPSADTTDPFTTVSSKKGKGKGRRKVQNGSGTPDVGPKEQIAVGCMTADFAMQNVLLQLGLSLVGVEGKRIEKVKTWVLRCHACFKICKDATKKFCPSCGNPTLLRTSVTAKAPTADDSAPTLQVHLKKNFVYRTRGTIFSIPAPKSGSSKKGSGEGLILREDQSEYMRAKMREDGRREREDKKILQRSLEAARKGETTGVRLGGWMDPDWMPEMLSVGTGGKGRRAPDGRTPLGPDGMPVVGHGRKNPNERRRKN